MHARPTPPRRRLAVLFLAAVLAGVVTAPAFSAAARAAEAGGAPKENYVKLPTVNVEFWDEQGIFHMVVVDASVVAPERVKLEKSLGSVLSQALAAMTWEEFSRGNPAATVKAIILDQVRKQPGAEKVQEVLLARLVIR